MGITDSICLEEGLFATIRYPIKKVDPRGLLGRLFKAAKGQVLYYLGEVGTFSTLEANSGYWKMEFDDRDKDKTTITSHHVLYRLLRMPFGLRNEPSLFQRVMDTILSPIKWQFALLYLVDVVIFPAYIEEQL